MKKLYIAKRPIRRSDNIYRYAALTVLALSVTAGVASQAPAIAAPAAKAAAPATPATPMLAAPEVSPAMLDASGDVTISLPPDFPLSTSRLQVGLFEAGRPARVADIRRDFTVTNGRLQAKMNIQASPGRYEIRLVSGDKLRQPISLGAPILVTGVQRSAGWWLLNGSPFALDATNGTLEAASTPGAAAVPGTALFATGLKRNSNQRNSNGKSKTPLISASVETDGATVWKTFELPPLTQMAKPGYDFNALKSTLQKQLDTARANGSRSYLAFVVPTNFPAYPAGVGTAAGPEPDAAAIKDTVGSLRTLLEELQPESALLLQVTTQLASPGNTAMLDAAGPLCDGIVISAMPPIFDNALWSLKKARRVAEEQPGYDLPIFVNLPDRNYVPVSSGASPDAVLLDLWMGGATGLLVHGNMPAWANTIERNLPLFVGSVTLEDIGLLPSDDTLSLYATLRAARRIPLLARLTPVAKGSQPSESFAIRLEDRISQAKIDQLTAAATSGARIYIEGTPFKDENGKEGPWRLGSLVGGVAKLLDGKDSAQRTSMTLEDGWMFGTGRGSIVPVMQRVTITVNKETVGGQAKQERGKDVLTAPRVAARLADGTPGLIINPVGKGEVIWMPHRPLSPRDGASASGGDSSSVRQVAPPRLTVPPVINPRGAAYIQAAARAAEKEKEDAVLKPQPAARLLNIDRSPSDVRFYISVADYLQPSLIQVRGTDANSAGAEAVRVALRRSARGAYIVALFNTSDRPAAVTASLDGAAGVALDLTTETELPLTVQGFSSSASLTIAPRGYSLIAFGASRQALDEERNTALSQAKLK